METPGKLIVISGPSGVGKGTLVRALLERHPQLHLSVSATTRSPRPGETDGEDYWFWSRQQFEAAIAAGNFVEWAEYAGNYYGTPRGTIVEQLDRGRSVLLEIELVGARQVRKTFPEAYSIFVLPPSLEVLEVRLRGRDKDSEAAIARRLERARTEIAASAEFDLQLVNDDLAEALQSLESAIASALARNEDPSPAAPEIRALFDRIAPVYDRFNDRLSLGQHRLWKQMAVDWANPQPGGFALDLCCGSGDLALLLARHVGSTGGVWGVDFSPALLAIARRRDCHRQVCWQEGDALALPFAGATFDCATIGYGLRNVTDIPACLAEVCRVLKPGGRAAILDFHRPATAWVRQLQEWYLANIVVPAAREFGLTDDYAYIAPSLERFPAGDEQVRLARSAGFGRAVHYPLAVGMMGVLYLSK